MNVESVKALGSRSRKTTAISSAKNKTGIVFKVGDKVQLTKKAAKSYANPIPMLQAFYAGRPVRVAKIVSFFPDVKGLAHVVPKLGGYWSWDVNDLEKVE